MSTRSPLNLVEVERQKRSKSDNIVNAINLLGMFQSPSDIGGSKRAKAKLGLTSYLI